MTKSKFLFTAILATMISAGAWAYAPGSEPNDVVTDPTTGAHDVYENAPTDDEANAGIAGVTYVNRVANRAGAAAQAAEDHAAHASASASAAQTSADSAADAASAASDAAADAASAAEVAKNITAGDGIVVTDKKDDNNNVVGKIIAVNPGKGIEIDKDNNTVAVNPGKGIEIDKDNNTVAVNLVEGANVTLDEDENGAVIISATAGDIILDATADHTLSNINAGEGIEIEQNGSNNEITDITVGIKPATETELGGLFAPASVEEAQVTAAELNDRGLGQDLIAVTYPLAIEIASQGVLSGAYPTIADANADFDDVDKQGMMQLRPLSAWAALEGQAAESAAIRAAIRAESDESYVNMPSEQELESEGYSLGDAARPVYVVDSVSDDGKHRGVVTAIESVAIPVGSENFAETITSENVAKIWIQ